MPVYWDRGEIRVKVWDLPFFQPEISPYSLQTPIIIHLPASQRRPGLTASRGNTPHRSVPTPMAFSDLISGVLVLRSDGVHISLPPAYDRPPKSRSRSDLSQYLLWFASFSAPRTCKHTLQAVLIYKPTC